MFKKLHRVWLVFVGIIIIMFLAFILSRGRVPSIDDLSYGVTFSARQAKELGIDPRVMYQAILDDLKVKKIRLAAYWDEIEPEEGELNWQSLDWQLDEAALRGATVVLAVGGRLPRWPECHFPPWAEKLDDSSREQAILDYIEATVKRYKEREEIIAWQVENEPFLPYFGNCPKLNTDFLDQEIALVKSLDTRPIMLTDSGELSVWVPAAKRADIFGTTMYRDTYSDTLERYIHYPIEPGFFRFKKNIARLFARPEKWIVVELQAEPWGPKPLIELTREERNKTMNLAKFREILEFSRQAGFREFYLWGVEWWYWEWQANGDDLLWNEAKGLFH